MELSGKSVILTGASRGIGRALARELAKSGAGLLLTALEQDELSSLSDELQSRFHVSVSAMVADLSNHDSLNSLVHWILNRKEPVDVLINNAGIGYFGRFEGSEWGRIDKTIALNISALSYITHELVPLLKRRTGAKIVNISSGIAWLPYPGLAVYGATKAFVSSFSQSLATELVGTSIKVLCFHPGFTMTSFMGSAGMDMSKIPRMVIHTPEEIATQILEAIKKDKQWAYSDFLTHSFASLGFLLPSRLRTRIFKNLFWRLPGGKQKNTFR